MERQLCDLPQGLEWGSALLDAWDRLSAQRRGVQGVESIAQAGTGRLRERSLPLWFRDPQRGTPRYKRYAFGFVMRGLDRASQAEAFGQSATAPPAPSLRSDGAGLGEATGCAHPIRGSTFATVAASHFPPRAVPMPRAFSAAAICRSVRPGGLRLANGRRNAVGECVGAGRVVRVGDRAGLGEFGICRGLVREPWRRLERQSCAH